MIPALPNPDDLEIAVKEAAAKEKVEPAAVEKDFHLTRLLWALAETFGEKLLLKGGTCLAKVDLGYHRMSEDADFVIPHEGSKSYKGSNAKKTNVIRDALVKLAPGLGLKLDQPSGIASEKNSHVIWKLEYSGRYPPTTLVVEVSLRPVLMKSRKAPLKQLLTGDIAAPYADAYCFALDAAEVRAEKIRAAFTREEPEIRDFFDLHLLARSGADLVSKSFIALVNLKLAEEKAAPLEEQPPRFGLSDEQLDHLAGDGMKRLTSVVRTGTKFDVKAAIAELDALWR